MNEKIRCFGDTPIYIDYHDNEWGRPVHDNCKLFEMLILEGAFMAKWLFREEHHV